MTRWHWPRRIDPKICACGRDTPGHDERGKILARLFGQRRFVKGTSALGLSGDSLLALCRLIGSLLPQRHVGVLGTHHAHAGQALAARDLAAMAALMLRQPFHKLRVLAGSAGKFEDAGDIFLFTTLNHNSLRTRQTA